MGEKSTPRMFEGESQDEYKDRLKRDGYSTDDEELDRFATDAWYSRRAEMRHQAALKMRY